MEPQATIESVALAPLPASVRCLGSVQSSLVNSSWSLAVAGSAEGVAAGESDGFGLSEAPGVGSLVRAPVTARPWVVALAEGVASVPVASSPSGLSPSSALSPSLALSPPSADSPGFGVALPEGLAEPDGVGAGPLACTVSTGRK